MCNGTHQLYTSTVFENITVMLTHHIISAALVVSLRHVVGEVAMERVQRRVEPSYGGPTGLDPRGVDQRDHGCYHRTARMDTVYG